VEEYGVGEDYGRDDRRISGDSHCSDHTRNQERIAICEIEIETMQKDTADIKTTLKEHGEILQSLNLCMTKISSHMGDFIKRYDERVAYGDKIISERQKDLIIIKEKIEELDEFAWFRRTMNKVRDNFIVIVFGGVVILFGALIAGWQKVKSWLITL